MKIKDIQVDGFGVWSGLTVHSMPDNMTVFYGPNEAGKTTLMQFLRTMFYGFTPDRRQRYMPPLHGGKPGGAIRVTGPGGGYEICRRAQLDQGGTVGNLTVTGSDGLSQGQHRLAMLLGQVDESIFTNVFAIGLRELQELSTLDDTAAADELYKLSSGLDRVSLVDVTRQLKLGRQQIVGPTPDHGQMQRLMMQREKLKDEIDAHTGNGRRWSELAALRMTQNSELDELKLRIAQWELEARTFEVALQVRPTWRKRSDIADSIRQLNARTDLPESAAERLAELSLERHDRETKLANLREQRKDLRESARKLPLRRGILELSSKIEAAAEQAPWIGSIQKNIQRLEGQIEQTQEQLIEDAKRLGITEEDQQALINDRRMVRMPDLSRQAINQLAEPASEVRMWSTRLKQAQQQTEVEKKETDRLEKELASHFSGRSDQGEIQNVMKQHGDLVGLLRKRMQIQETLDKQIARRGQLEEEAVDLTVDEGLHVERAFLLGTLFVGGVFLFLWGLAKLLPSIFGGTPEAVGSQTGLLLVVSGMFSFFLWMILRNSLERSTVAELEDVEDQVEAIRKEIRKTEAERDDFERRLPAYNGPIENRLRDAEVEITHLEGLLPLQHNLQAATERYSAARKRVSQANDSLRSARSQWQKTLTQLGLSESLSPKSIRIMAEGYDSLLQTRRRMQSLEEELETRQLEMGAITQRIDALARQVFAAKAANEIAHSSGLDEPDDEVSNKEDFKSARRRELTNAAEVKPVKAGAESANVALQQLAKLSSLISSQEQFIHQKRAMKEQDQQLAKQAAAVQKSVDKIDRIHSALLAEHGCESEQQLLDHLKLKQEHKKLLVQLSEFGERIQAVISGTVPYETIERLLDSPGADDLEKRWEAIGQRSQQAEKRVEQLQLRQGELGQEMKSLAASSRLAEAKLEMSCVENQLKACAAHWQTLAATTILLDRVCEVYETERQPETLREASAFLSQLTNGKYLRIWTPLGKNQLRIDNAKGQALPLEVLSRGTRETVFIALRLSLAAAYARRGVTIPLVLDDVLVNFDAARAQAAAKVLRDFASLGHQVVMFTCHEHIMRIFYEIGVQVRVLPPQGQPGEAEIYYSEAMVEHPQAVPEEVDEPEPFHNLPEEEEFVPEPLLEQTLVDEVEEVEELVAKVMQAPKPIAPKPIAPLPALKTNQPKARRVIVSRQEPDIDWLWYEKTPEAVELGWVESQELADEKLVPSDLWWNRTLVRGQQ